MYILYSTELSLYIVGQPVMRFSIALFGIWIVILIMLFFFSMHVLLIISNKNIFLKGHQEWGTSLHTKACLRTQNVV
jgi:hypothetical protein